MKNNNISEIRRSLEPSEEMKRRVMERAAKLEAGRKTFGNERTTADNRHIITDKTKEKKENITMSTNRSELNTVKNRMPAAVLSAAACAAIIIGISSVLHGSDSKLLTDKGKDTAQLAAESDDAGDNIVTDADDGLSEAVMTVTDKYGSTYSITDQERIAAIDALVEKAAKCHVWEGEKVPTERTIEYTLNGTEHTVEISEGQLSPYHPDSYPHPEICLVVTVDGRSYAVCEFTPDEPYYALDYATSRSGELDLRKWIKESSEINNEDDYRDSSFGEEYHNEADARKLKGIIDSIRENSTPQFEAEDQYTRDEEHLPSWDDVRASCRITLDGNCYDVELFWDSDLIVIDVLDWHDGKDLTLLYKDTQDWIAQFDEIFDDLKNDPEFIDAQAEDDELYDPQIREPSENDVIVPEITDMTEEQAAAALKEAGLNCLIEYCFSGVEKGYINSYFCTDPEVFSIGEDIYAPRGSNVVVEISLGEYNGAYGMIRPEGEAAYYPTKESKLEVPVPDGLSGSYNFNIYSGGDAEYTHTEKDIKGVKSVTLDVNAGDKQRLVVYAENNNSKEEKLIRYADYEFDYEAETWTLIGELGTEELLGTMD